MKDLIDITTSPVRDCLGILLEDKTTKKTIIWATDSYQSLGNDFLDNMHMDPVRVLEAARVMKPRSQKTFEDQVARTRKRAEVFTPAFIVNQMNNHADSIWFGRKVVFNIETEDGWKRTTEPIQFPANKNWKEYVDSRRMEIACGEGPYLVSRYDAATGEAIPLHDRIGLLDRKLRIVTENAESDEWVKWALRAIESIYGYEYQGDNLLMARSNVFLTFVDYHREALHTMPTAALLRRVAHIIAWNLWQMDGLNDRVPLGKHFEPEEQLSFFAPPAEAHEETLVAYPCKIKDWRSKTTASMDAVKEREMGKKLFDYVIGNPPYQEEKQGTSDKPVYNEFMDAAYEISSKVMLITPARFLFNAGKTPKNWNKKMLSDEYLRVLFFAQKSGDLFPNTDIKGGVAITYRDEAKKGESIETFVVFEELRSIMSKVRKTPHESFSELIYAPESYKLAEKLHEQHPEAESLLSKGHKYDVTTNIFEKLPELFRDKGSFEKGDVQIYGRKNGKRAAMWIRRDFITGPDNFESFKVFVPKSNGSGALGEVLSTPLIGEPLIGHTQTFLSIGKFKTEEESRACLKYIKSKFARVLLGVLKITQDNKKDTWKYVPLQDFTASSDIDWSASVAAIDRQLYRKYNLSSEEIDFIETHVKEMV